MAVVLKEVEHSDFNQINELFIEVYGKIPNPGFKRAFFDHNPLLGYCLVDEGLEPIPIVGYFGCFTYNRSINSKIFKFYNTHTWIVKEEYRKHSLKLLMPFMRLKDGIVTNFSANGKVAQILEQLKFRKIKVQNYCVSASFNLKSYLKQQKIKQVALMDDVTKWHEPYVGLCLNLKLPNNQKTIEIILKKVNKKPSWVNQINKVSRAVTRKPLITQKYFYYKVHYVNRPEALLENLDLLTHYLFLKVRIGGLILPQGLIKNFPAKSIQSRYDDDVYIKSNLQDIPNLDYLYSEVFYLNILDK